MVAKDGEENRGGWISQLNELKASLEDGDFENGIPLCESLLKCMDEKTNGNDDELEKASLRGTLYETYMKCLLRENQPEKVVSVYKEVNNDEFLGNSLRQLYIYALYRLEKYELSADLSNDHYDDDDKEEDEDRATSYALSQIHAQSLFHLSETKKAVAKYSALLEECTGKEDGENDEHNERRMELLTNLSAVAAANATPYVRQDDEVEQALREDMETFLDNANNNDNTTGDEYPYDLAFNLATWELTTNAASQTTAQALLKRAQAGCVAALKPNDEDGDGDDNNNDDEEGISEEDLQRELAPIASNLQWSRSYWSGMLAAAVSGKSNKGSASGLPPAVEAVQSLNRALAVSAIGPPEGAARIALASAFSSDNNNGQPTKGFSPLQIRLYLYNKAVLQLRAGDPKACETTCRLLTSSLQTLSSSKRKRLKQTNKGQATIALQNPAPSAEDALWWESRVAVVRAYACQQSSSDDEGKGRAAAMKELESCVTKLNEMPASPVRDHALCFALLHQFELGEENHDNSTSTAPQDKVLRRLEGLPASIRERNAVQASIASIYQQKGETEAATQLLEDTGDNQARAKFLQAQGNHREAADIYAQAAAESSDDPEATAKWVQALSHVDPEKAREVWKQLQSCEDINIEDYEDDDDNAESLGAELEERKLPRLKTSKSRKSDLESSSAAAATMSEHDQPPQNDVPRRRSHESVLRRRAKQREAYLADLQARGLYRPGSKPDPERWIPKYERSYARRRRGGNRGGAHKGAQGGVSEKDAAKLDVMARQAARAAGEELAGPKSTSHMKVTSSGGATRKSKGGRRR